MKSVKRLYSQFQPNHYDLTLDLDEKSMRFSGTVVVEGKKTGRPAQRLTLHQNGLTVTAAKIVLHDKKGDQQLPITRINNHDSYNEVRLHTDRMVYPGNYTLTLQFEAPITSGMTGIYPSYFKDGTADKMLLATQFESHHAREAFPCIDEPEAKATFDLTLITQTGVTSLGNMPAAKQTNKQGRQTTVFETTPKMSSYLLAFVTGEMHSKSIQTNRGTDVSLWAAKTQPADSFDFGLDIAKRSIEFFEDYFGVPYPLAKVDHVALPDFSSGAMENWGLITYRERVLLAYPGETAQTVLEQIATVIAHETSHQWFGNLVTMRWWDDLWLNESFANLMEYQAIDSMHPEWHMWDGFIAAEGLAALRRDAVPGVQAVRSEVHHPDEISSLFDSSIVYAKGGRLLYMLKNYIGDETFRAGLKRYFELHAYSNTEGSDLWATLSEVSGKDIAAFMNPWLTRPGFPLVTITQQNGTVTLAQEQFLENPTKADPDRLWPVPLFAGDPVVPEVLAERTVSLEADTSPIILNSGAKGHYIVRYAADAQKKFVVAKAEAQTLAEPDRLMLLNGGSMLAKAGYEPFSNILAMLGAYRAEASEPVWDIMALVISEARRFIDVDPSLEDKIKQFIDKLTTAQYRRLGWESETEESVADQKLRALILSLGAYAEKPKIIRKAKELFAAYMAQGQQLSPELRALIFIVPIKAGDDRAFEYLLDLHDRTQNSDLKSDTCDALTATRDPKKAARLLARLTDAKLIKPQDIDHWLLYLLRNRYTRDTAWDWLVDNWNWLEKTFKNDKTYDYLPRYAASCVNTRTYQRKFTELFESKVLQPLLERNILVGMEEIENRINWLERDLKPVQDFFK